MRRYPIVLLKLHVLSPDVRALVVAVEGRHAHREDGRRKSPRRAVEGGVADVARALDSDVVRVARLGRDDGPAGARLRKRTSQKISKFFPSVLPIEKRSIFPGAAFGRNSAVGDVESGRVNSSILESGETCVRERSLAFCFPGDFLSRSRQKADVEARGGDALTPRRTRRSDACRRERDRGHDLGVARSAGCAARPASSPPRRRDPARLSRAARKDPEPRSGRRHASPRPALRRDGAAGVRDV